ncbi:MAG: hypothetical protein JJ992_06095, partial [Planctomycetes bacterium]|nr:hypothetical protein [Planctomycetota bacterium]
MIERHKDSLEFFVSPAATADRDGTAERPYADLHEALLAIAASIQPALAEAPAPRRRSVEIRCVGTPGDVVRPTGKPRYRFFVDTQATARGSGSEFSPWQDLPTALESLSIEARQGRVALRKGQSLTLKFRDAFTPTALERWKTRKEMLAKYVFLTMALMLVVPVLLILSYLVFKAWPVLSPHFLLTNPKDYMTAGGIWAPLIGTFFLVLLSLLIAAP